MFPRFEPQRLPHAYEATAKRNVDKAHATVVFRAKSTLRVDRILGYCLTREYKAVPEETMRELEDSTYFYKPFLVVSDWKPTTANCERLRAFLRLHNPKVLNITGHGEKPSFVLRGAAAGRESVDAAAAAGGSIQKRVRTFLLRALPQEIE